MSRIVSFDQFKPKSDKVSDQSHSYRSVNNEGHDHESNHEGGHQHYMFFQNLISIKHHIEEILNMNPDQVDDLLKNGHDWACDHIATSKDDIQEVGEWLRNEMEMSADGGEHHEEEEEEEDDQENIVVDIEGDNDEVDVEDEEEAGNGEESEEEEDEEDDEDEEEEEEEESYNEDDEYNLGEGFDDDNYDE